jgi:hypothetical protein
MKRIVFGLLLLGFLAGAPAQAKTYRYTIMTDDDLTVNALSASDIERTLSEYGSGYAGVRVTDTDGRKRLVSRIIYKSARQHRINAEALLALLQKESSGLTSGSRNDFAMGFGVCDSCSSAEIQQYRGVAKQFRLAARQLRYDYDILKAGGSTISGWRKDSPRTTLDGHTVIPETHATALMLSYNPFIGAYDGGDPSFGGVSLLRRIWNNYFAKRGRVRYPNGTVFKIKRRKGYYLIQNDRIRRFASATIMRSMLPNADDSRIVKISQRVANDQYRFYEAGRKIRLPNGIIAQNRKSGAVYLISNGKKRGFTQEGLRAYGYYPEQIQQVRPRDLRMPEGRTITGYIEFPGGALVKVEESGKYFYVNKNNTRRLPIKNRALLRTRFARETLLTVPRSRMKKYPIGKKALLANGTLVTSKTTSAVWLIERRKRRRVASQQVMRRYGYRQQDVVQIPHKLLKAHKKGAALTLKKVRTRTDR